MKKKPLFPVLLTYFLDNFGLAIVYPIFTPIILLPNHELITAASSYLHRTLLLGLLIGAFPLAQFIGAPLIGQFSDKYGRKRAFYFTILGAALGYTFTALSIMTHAFALLFLCRFITGFFAGNLTLCLAAIVDMSPDETSRAKNFGHIAAIGGLSFIIAIAFGGFLSDPTLGKYLNPSFPFWITALLAYVNFVCMILLFDETHITKPSTGFHPFKGFSNILFALRQKELRSVYAGNFFFMLSWVGTMQFFPTFLIKHFSFPTIDLTTSLIFVGVLWSLSNFIINRKLAQRFHPANTLNVCLFLLSILLFGLAFAQRASLFLALFYPAVCCASLAWTNSLANVSLKAPNTIQGSILGINQSMNSLAAMIAPPLAGLLAGTSSNWMHAVTALFSLTACILLTRAHSRYTN